MISKVLLQTCRTATARDGGTAIAGDGGSATAGDRGILQIRWHDNSRYRIATAYVGEDGILPHTAYVLQNGKFVKQDSAHATV